MMLEETRRRTEEERLMNVDIVQSSENNFVLKDNAVDIIFTSTVFHEVDSPRKFLAECRRILKNDGRLVILDWNKIDEDFGPPRHKRIDIEEVKKYLSEGNFDIKDINYVGNSFYIVEGM